jgi:hypothetical protein
MDLAGYVTELDDLPNGLDNERHRLIQLSFAARPLACVPSTRR